MGMLSMVDYWICEIALLISGFIYVHTIERRETAKKWLTAYIILFFVFVGGINYWISVVEILWMEILLRIVGFLFLVFLLHTGWILSWKACIYYAIWAFLSWQLLYELWIICGLVIDRFSDSNILRWIGEIGVFAIGQAVIYLTIGTWMPDGGRKKIGPRQVSLALLTFTVFEIIVLVPGNFERQLKDARWMTMYFAQLMIAVILYLENELFKKSEMRQELDMMNLLWKKEQEQYQLSKETIALINQKCHDLKHQIRLIRTSTQGEIGQYLEEIEESVGIYESIVNTGNEVVDTILTEKSLYCREKGITVSCVADGSLLDFINTVDLYAIMGNAIDNAIEAVEKFEECERRQIDVMIYRREHFLAINIINPSSEKLVYEEGLPVTTKGNRDYHGFGLKSVKYLLKKYDGVLSIIEEDGCFSLMMLVPIP